MLSTTPAAFYKFTMLIFVVTAVGQHIASLGRQYVDLPGKTHVFGDIGCVDRGQQRPNRPIFRSCHNHLVAVALHPSMVRAIAPLTFPIDAM